MTIIFIVLSSAIVMILVEAIVPDRQWIKVPYWLFRATAFNAFQGFSAFVGAVSWDLWLQNVSIIDLSRLSPLTGAAVGYFFITFIYYWWHRARHEIPFLWRWLHQIHHSPQRIEIITSFYKHPLEIMFNGVLSSFILVSLLGLNPASTAIAVGITGVAELIYHWNIKTPYWLGYIFQRPESHCVHHRKGVHTRNYSDLPLWDIIFGTFYNPKTVDFECGFAENRELNITKMLIGRNVNRMDK